MALGLIDKLTNFLMPIEDETEKVSELPSVHERKTHLKVHSAAALRVYIGSPASFDDVRYYADQLCTHIAVIVNYDSVDDVTQQRIADFLNGILYAVNGSAQRISDTVQIYLPSGVEASKELFSYSVPTYIRKSND